MVIICDIPDLGIQIYPENKSIRILWNVGKILPDHTVAHSKKQHPSERQIADNPLLHSQGNIGINTAMVIRSEACDVPAVPR
jgi:1,6-anhydro-N-acetylmuramate kinase